MTELKYTLLSFSKKIEPVENPSYEKAKEAISPLDKICDECGGVRLPLLYSPYPQRSGDRSLWMVRGFYVENSVSFEADMFRTQVLYLEGKGSRLIGELRKFYDGMIPKKRTLERTDSKDHGIVKYYEHLFSKE